MQMPSGLAPLSALLSDKKEWNRDILSPLDPTVGQGVFFYTLAPEILAYERYITLSILSETLGAYQARDPAARSKLEVFLLYPGVHATIYHRIAHGLWTRDLRFFARAVSQWSRFWTGIEIHPGATIGRRLVIDHGSGIVIGETAEIGDDCLLYHGVTLGGTGKDQGKRHPTLGNNVLVGNGARILGPFKVGDNARIAAGSVVLSEVPPDSTAVGVPAQIVRVHGQETHYADDVDQINVENPLLEKMAAMSSRLEFLEKLLDEYYLKQNPQDDHRQAVRDAKNKGENDHDATV